MGRFFTLCLVLFLLIFGGLLTFKNGFFVLLLPLLFYLGVGALFSPTKLELTIQREISPRRVPANTPFQVMLTIQNRGVKSVAVFLEEVIPEGVQYLGGERSLFAELAAGENCSLQYKACATRGLYRFQDLRATSSDPFGIFSRKSVFSAPAMVLVLPQISPIKRLKIRPRQTRMYRGSVPARQGGSGIDFFGVRNYYAGDPLRIINWKASARHPETFFSNEFEQERVATVWLILDARWRSNICTAKGSLFEYAVTATAALSQALLNQGNRVGLLVYGGFLDWIYPGYGRNQREQILRALAKAQPGESLIFDKLENLPTRVFPLHSQIIVISPIQNEDLALFVRLRARGYSLMVVSPDPVVFDKDDSEQGPEHQLGFRFARLERNLLIARLRQAGVEVINWDVEAPFEQVMHISLQRMPPWFHAIGWRL